METGYSPEDLEAFTSEIVSCFEDRQIRAPIHLDDGNYEQLIRVFREHVDPEDWVLGTWRMQCKCLLKGVPRDELRSAILAGRSISLCFPEHRILSSAIVTGTMPIAVGIALGIKRSGGTNKVVVFLGDMGSETGIFHECRKYCRGHDLPVVWVVEDNGKSVCTETLDAWGLGHLSLLDGESPEGVMQVDTDLVYYSYRSRYPHAGGLKRVNF